MTKRAIRRRRVSDEIEAACDEKREPQVEYDEVTDLLDLTIERVDRTTRSSRVAVTRASSNLLQRLSRNG